MSVGYDFLPKPGLAILKNLTKSPRVALAVVNSITASRLLTIPMAIWGFWPSYTHGQRTAAVLWLVGAVVLAAVTDAYDGILARELEGGKSEFGATLDPAMDKAFAVTYFYVLILMVERELGRVDVWLVYNMVIDLLLVVMAIAGKLLLSHRQISNQALWSGKVKFNLQVVAVMAGFLMFINADSTGALRQAGTYTDLIAGAAGLFGTISLCQHAYGALRSKKVTV